jgi:hypothetical protein
MAKGIKCTVICNTRWGYCMTPRECKSISEAVRYAKDLGMAYRVFVDGKVVKSGW